MLDQLRALAVFARVADAGSFRAAAKHLGITASVVSHHVTALERHLDTPLIYRTTRKLSLTEAGEHLAVSARAMVREAEAGFEQIGHKNASPLGRLKITAPAILQHARFVTRVSTFMKHYPKVEISITFSDQRFNIVEEGFDLAFRVGWLEDSSLMARKLADGRLRLCAAPDYFKDGGAPESPDALGRFELIELVGTSRIISLAARGTQTQPELVRIVPRISVDSGFAARRLAEQGCGIVLLPDFFVTEALEAGRLVEVLPDWEAKDYAIYAVWPANTGTNLLRTLFVDFIAGIARTGPEDDKALTVKGPAIR